MKTLLILGPPGAGKGTQAERIAAAMSLQHLSTGQIFRENIAAGSELGKQAAAYIAAGDYVPDAITDAMVAEHCGKISGGILLDGYPRTLEQCHTLANILDGLGRSLDCALNLDVPKETVIARLLHRAEIEHRADDTEDVIRHRLNVYHEQTEPVIAYYHERGLLRTVDGSGDIEAVWAAIAAELGV